MPADRHRTRLRDRLRRAGESLRGELAVWRLVLADARTPLLPKLLLAAAVGYVLMPFDLIPDCIPLLGQLDDLVIVPALLALAVRMVPREVLADCRARANTQAGPHLLIPTDDADPSNST